MSLDSEDSNLTELVKSSKIGNNYYIKPLINVANLLDPGRGGSSTGQRGGTMDRLTRQLFKNEQPYVHYKFDVNTYVFNFGDHMSVSIYVDDTKFNISVNDVPLEMGTTTKKAKVGGVIEKISKFMGDFAQVLTVAHQYKNGLRVVSGTLDGVFIGITAFVHKELFGLKPRIFFDNSTYGNNGIIIHGFDDLLIKSNSIKQSPTVAEYIKRMNANATLNNNSRATTRINGMVESTKSVRKSSAKRSRSSNIQQNVPMPKRARRLTHVSRGAPSRNNTAEMPPQRRHAVKRVRSTTDNSSSNSQISVEGKNLIVSNASSGITKRRRHNSVTQNRSGNEKVESITRTKSPESVARTKSAKTESITRTVSARQRSATSNSARSNQTRG